MCINIFCLFTDTYAMAGMALQCVSDSGSHVQNAAELDTALIKIKQKLLAFRRADGHIGNEFSTGLAVQVCRFFTFVYVCESPQNNIWMLTYTYLLYSRPCWQWAALLASVRPQWKP